MTKMASAPKSGIYTAVYGVLFFIFLQLSNENIIQLLTPAMADDFGITKARVSLIVSIGGLVFGIGGALYSTLTDLFSMRQLYLFSIITFAGGSLLAFAVHDSFAALAVARFVQCVGGAGAQGCFIVLVTRYLPARDQPKYLALSSVIFMFSAGLGAWTGAVVASFITWTYALLLPVAALIVLPPLWRHLPRERRGEGRLDLPGAAIVTVVMMSATMSITFQQVYGLVIAMAGIWIYWQYARRREQPFLNLSVLRVPGFVSTLLTAVMMFGVQAGVLFLLPFVTRDVFGLSMNETGLLFLVAYVPAMWAGVAAGRMANRFGCNRTFYFGWSLFFVCLLLLVCAVAGRSLVLMWLALLVFAVGSPCMYTGIVATATGQLPNRQLGSGTGMFLLMMGMGNGLYVSLIGLLLTNGRLDRLPLRLGGNAVGDGYGPIFLMLVVMLLIPLMVYVRMHRRTGQPVPYS